MFEVGKKYKIGSGREYECVATMGNFGWLNFPGEGCPCTYTFSHGWEEIKPRLTRRYWVTHYMENVGSAARVTYYDPREDPVKWKNWCYRCKILSCIEHTDIFEEGEGVK